MALQDSDPCLYVSETFSVSQLRKGHTEKLIPTRKCLDLVIAMITFYTLLKLVARNKIHKLSKNGSANIHKPPPYALLQKYGLWRNNFQIEKSHFAIKTHIYLYVSVFLHFIVGTVVIISVISILTMWALLHYKIKAGKQLNSHAILADAECTRTCVYLSIILLLSSIGYELTGIGGFDSIGAIGIAMLSYREGKEAFQKARGEINCSCAAH